MDPPFSSPWLNVSYVYKPKSELHTPFVHNPQILVFCEWLETWETIILVMDPPFSSPWLNASYVYKSTVADMLYPCSLRLYETCHYEMKCIKYEMFALNLY